jgi:hypothetical protein
MKSDTDYFGQYWKKGWVVVEGVFKPEEVDRIATLALAIAEKERNSAMPGYNLNVTS